MTIRHKDFGIYGVGFLVISKLQVCSVAAPPQLLGHPDQGFGRGCQGYQLGGNLVWDWGGSEQLQLKKSWCFGRRGIAATTCCRGFFLTKNSKYFISIPSENKVLDFVHYIQVAAPGWGCWAHMRWPHEGQRSPAGPTHGGIKALDHITLRVTQKSSFSVSWLLCFPFVTFLWGTGELSQKFSCWGGVQSWVRFSVKRWKLSQKTREKRIFVSGTLTLQKALLGRSCRRVFQFVICSVGAAGSQCLQCLTRKRTFRWSWSDLLWDWGWLDLVEGRTNHDPETSSSSWSTQRWIPLLVSEHFSRMYLPLQRADQLLTSQVQGGNRDFFSTHAKLEDKSPGLERTFFFSPTQSSSRAWWLIADVIRGQDALLRWCQCSCPRFLLPGLTFQCSNLHLSVLLWERAQVNLSCCLQGFYSSFLFPVDAWKCKIEMKH